MAVATLEAERLATRQRRHVSVQEALAAVEKLRAEAAANGIADMTMDEIDAEIAAWRKERASK